jgi:hypothetical protein
LIARTFLAEHDLERRQRRRCNPNLRMANSLFFGAT